MVDVIPDKKVTSFTGTPIPCINCSKSNNWVKALDPAEFKTASTPSAAASAAVMASELKTTGKKKIALTTARP